MAYQVVKAILITVILSVAYTSNAWAIPPTANSDEFVGDEDTLIDGNVLDNDTPDDPTNDIEVYKFIAPATGVLTLDDSGKLSYEPEEHFSGRISVPYTVRELAPTCIGSPSLSCFALAAADLVVLPVADAPNVSASDVSGDEDTTVSLNLTAELVDVDGSETADVQISGVPNEVTLSPATFLGGGIYAVNLADVPLLQATPVSNGYGSASLSMDVTVTDAGLDAAGSPYSDSVSVSTSFNITVNSVK